MNSMQQEFDAVVQHLYKQGRPAVTASGACVYRAKDGCMCAVGCRIPDEVYIPDMDSLTETTDLNSILSRHGDVLPQEIHAYKGMFRELQNAHDSNPCDRYGNFAFDILSRSLQAIAETHNLTFTEPPRPGEQAQ